MGRESRFYVYIMPSKSWRIYSGVTNNIHRRVMQHKRGDIEGFTQKYRINRLVYYREFQYVGYAIAREKEIKGWDRAKRVSLIEQRNPTWDDSAEDWGKPVEILAQPPRKADPSLASPPRDDNS